MKRDRPLHVEKVVLLNSPNECVVAIRDKHLPESLISDRFECRRMQVANFQRSSPYSFQAADQAPSRPLRALELDSDALTVTTAITEPIDGLVQALRSSCQKVHLLKMDRCGSTPVCSQAPHVLRALVQRERSASRRCRDRHQQCEQEQEPKGRLSKPCDCPAGACMWLMSHQESESPFPYLDTAMPLDDDVFCCKPTAACML